MAEKENTTVETSDTRTPPSAGGPSRIQEGPQARFRHEQRAEHRREREAGYGIRAPQKRSTFKKLLPYLIAGGSTAGALGIAGLGNIF